MTDVVKARVHSIESFGSVDGPGVRFVLFLKGCNMRCQYCHNADTWNPESEDLRTADELLAFAMRYKSYWGVKGGITVSGGEPLLQIDFLLEFFKKAKAKGIHTCIDTAMQPFTRKEPFFSKFRELMKYTDLLLVDIKHIDAKEHVKLTGVSNENILDGIRFLSEIGKPIWIRQVLLPGYTDKSEYLIRTRQFLDTLTNVKRVEVLPYHSMGAFKWEKLHIPYKLKDVKAPGEKQIENARHILRAS